MTACYHLPVIANIQSSKDLWSGVFCVAICDSFPTLCQHSRWKSM